uniref:Cytochrome b6-f complex subunit 7 n=2 Tax=Corallina TaxID=35169 RepID=A0A6M3WE40_COROI|nr:cytochrome b6-f complex subunit VII [Corallina ferreyrae]QJF58420.1 cytochrome b6-f complex subunit VII [Corallina officinalis]QBL75677.1 cytochrome b6-f complex subunit VII [Corallina ferreyrae]QJF58619.1 cytochrome b6-f complex subunit VII [Corallina officinalis]QJF58818.1 cytochrome b6-f complex subunit VII [Corallina officinalis]QJF59017.1 cytochrome b6-f complex subunit VII [Corallina officinalis]
MGNEIIIVALISSVLIISGLILGFALLKVQGE